MKIRVELNSKNQKVNYRIKLTNLPVAGTFYQHQTNLQQLPYPEMKRRSILINTHVNDF